MKNSTNRKTLTPFFIAFLVLALVFLAVGLGTLGSFRTTGEDFVLKAPVRDKNGEEQTSTVVFRVESSVIETYTDSSGKEQTRSVSLTMDDVYLNINAIYSEAGTSAGISLRRSMSSSSGFGGQIKASLENLYTPETEVAEGETAPKGPDATDVLYNWVNPFKITSNYTLGTYRYWELSATTANIRLAEVVFVGRPTSPDKYNEGKKYVVEASVYSATPDTTETNEQARLKAEALLDADINLEAKAYNDLTADEVLESGAQLPALPTSPKTSYDSFSKSELYSLLTIVEMRDGNSYYTDINGVDNSVYHAESVYNVLGMDLLALGTAMFGISPFGLRFFPMLFSFGILMLGFFFVKRLTKSDRAGFLFAILYALCDLSFSLGHLGTPLTAGLFFLLLAVYLVHGFYANGMKQANLRSVLPLVFGGLSAAAAICVNGAMLIPVLGVCGLFVAGMLRQEKANAYYMDKAIAEYEAEPEPEEEGAVKDKSKVAKVLNDTQYKRRSAAICFPAALVLGTVILSILFMLPVYYPLIKLYDNPVNPTGNLFTLGWKAFAGGYVGVNMLGNTPSAWSLFLTLFKGTGEAYAVTGAVINPLAALAGLAGIGFAIYRIVVIAKHFDTEGKQLRRVIVPLAGLVVSLICASFGGGALGFILLAYIFSFMLAAEGTEYALSLEGKGGKIAKICTITALVLLLVCFALFAIFTFSVPMPAAFMAKFFG